VASSSKPALGRPPDRAKAEQIIEAAWQLFLAGGVSATSMEAIARKAGVSKVTLYAKHPDKEALFALCLQREMDRIEVAQGIHEPPPPGQTFEETLFGFGAGIMTFLATDAAVSFYGAMARELRHSPALAESFWQIGPGTTKRNLVRVISAGISNGDVERCDPDEAAEVLIGAWQGFSNYQLALGIHDQDTHEAIAARVHRGVTLFMRAYGVGKR
jgi:TetR/AcrR family transcriptional regulator, mexJK operon transcriptional repressor